MTIARTTHVAAVVGAWLQDGRSPRDAMANSAAIRALPDHERAAVARAAARALGAQRRLQFACRGVDVATLPHLVHAHVLAVADALHAGELQAVAAHTHLRGLGLGGFTVDDAASTAVRIAAIEDPLRRLAVGHSLPDWLAREFESAFGATTGAVLAALAEPAPRTVRSNLLRAEGREQLAARLAGLGIQTQPTRFSPWGLHVQGHADLFDTALYGSGWYEQQDEASQLAALVVAPPPRGRVLDACAGSGGKTLALAAMLGNRGEILATDVNARRLAALRARLLRAGVHNTQVAPLTGERLPDRVRRFAARADRVFVDAPCSGTGSWRRRPEARWSLRAEDLAQLAEVQDRLLHDFATGLAPGARLVYATCSLLPAENEGRVRSLLDRVGDLELVRLAEVLGGAVAETIADATGTFLTLRPDRHGCDGFFAAILRRPRASG